MYFPKVLKKSFSARHRQWKKILNTVITMESPVVTLQCEPWLVCLPQPLKQADLQYLSSELNQFPMKYTNTYFWSPKCKGTIFMALVSGTQAYHGGCGRQRGGSLRHVFSDKNAALWLWFPLGLWKGKEKALVAVTLAYINTKMLF